MTPDQAETLARSERDAARYRHLREKSNIIIEGKESDWSGGYFPEQFDEFIDKEMAAAEATKGDKRCASAD